MTEVICCICKKVVNTKVRWPKPMAMPDGRLGHGKCAIDWMISECRRMRAIMNRLLALYPAPAA